VSTATVWAAIGITLITAAVLAQAFKNHAAELAGRACRIGRRHAGRVQHRAE
jgi:heme exporter protein D